MSKVSSSRTSLGSRVSVMLREGTGAADRAIWLGLSVGLSLYLQAEEEARLRQEDGLKRHVAFGALVHRPRAPPPCPVQTPRRQAGRAAGAAGAGYSGAASGLSEEKFRVQYSSI